MFPIVLTIWLAATAGAGVPDHAVVLLYHHIDASAPASTSTPPELFAAHLDWLKEHDRTVLPLDRVAADLAAGRPLPDGAVALTFDDGYRSVLTEAFPRLSARGWPFTVFVCPEAVDAGRGPVLTWDELRELATGGASIANHGLRHEHLQRRRPGEDDAAWRTRLRGELLAAQARIEEEIGAAPPVFAYPYGEYDPDLRALVIELGWSGWGQQSGPAGAASDPAVLPRFPMTGTYGAMDVFPEKLRSLPLPVESAAPRDPRIDRADPEARRPVLVLDLPGTAADWTRLAAYTSGQGRSPLSWVDSLGARVRIRPAEMLVPGRNRTNVTAPSAWPGRWYWYSHNWIVGEKHEN